MTTKRFWLYHAFVATFACLFAGFANAADDIVCHAASPPHSVALLELYTSEGCSSCPPADARLRELPAKGLDHTKVIPLSLHVDYWNALGWPDPYSDAVYTERQRQLVRINGLRTLYTPQFVLNGEDFRPWSFWDRLQKRVAEINRLPAQADIRLAASLAKTNRLRVSGVAHARNPSARVRIRAYLALYENKLTSEVTAGENATHVLNHDYVVRTLIGPLAFNAQGEADLSRTLRLQSGWKPEHSGVAAFVQQLDTGEILQALALPLCAAR